MLTRDNPPMVAKKGSLPPSPEERFPFVYRREIDGLRAVAVLAVLFCHAKLGFPGGYVGVDVFFVISGFLITSLLVRDLELGRFSIVDFWERRIRRIFPALAVVLVATVSFGGFYLLSIDYERFGASLMSVTGIVSNFYFWLTDGYFGGRAQEKPLLHTWSLSVEEQFYLCLPVSLYLLYRFAPWLRHGRRLFLLLSGLTLGSLILAGVAVEKGMYTSAYFLLPSRAWEMLLGSVLAVLPVTLFPVRRPVREAAAWLGLGLIIGASLLYTKRTPFPGFAALAPCGGAALLIWAEAASRGDVSRLTLCGRFLALKPMVGIGLISYSLYLWHWPFYAWANYTYQTSATRAGLMLLAMGLAILSWKWVETPVRKKGLLRSRKQLFGFFAIVSLLLWTIGWVIVGERGFGQRFSGRMALNDELVMREADSHRTRTGNHLSGRAYFTDYLEKVRAGDLVRLGSADRTPSVVLFGDSHAEVIAPIVSDLLMREGKAGVMLGKGGICPILGITVFDSVIVADIAKEAVEYVEEHPELKTILLAVRWTARYQYDKENFADGLAETVRRLRGSGRTVIVMKQVPESSYEVPRMVGLGIPLKIWAPTEASHREYTHEVATIIESLSGVTVLDPLPYFRRPGSDYLWVEQDGVSLYQDTDHLTLDGMEKTLRPFLEAELTPFLKEEPLPHSPRS